MHWLPILVISALTLAAQSVVAPRVELFGARPDFLLILVLFFGLSGTPHRAVVIGWGLGFFADLMSVERMGLMSLTYGLTALLLVSVREFLFRRGPTTQFFVAFILAMLIRAAWTVYVQVLYGASAGSLRSLLIAALYTAALAPIACLLLGRIAPVLGLQRRSANSGRFNLRFSHV